MSLPDREDELQKQGEEAERHIIKLLKPVGGRGTQLFSSLESARLRTPNLGKLDILLNLSGVRFAISVKSKRHEKVKVFYDSKHKQIRYSTKEWGKSRFVLDVTLEINEQVDWLLANRPKLFSKKKKPKMPWKIVVFSPHPSISTPNLVEVAVCPDSPQEIINGTAYLKDKGVYVVDQESLVSLIQVLKNKPNEEYVSN